MRKLIVLFAVLAVCPVCAFAQADTVKTDSAAADTVLAEEYQVAAEMAEEVVAAKEVEPQVEKPKYWTTGLSTQLGFSQVGITQWADGANQSISFNSFIDAFANYAKDKIIWETRLQLAYGMVILLPSSAVL